MIINKKSNKLVEKKADLLERFQQIRSAILGAAIHFKPEHIHQPFIGVWNILDLLAHLRGWDEANLQGAQAVLAGRLPDFYAHHDADWATFNASLVRQYKLESLEELVAAVRVTHSRLIAYLEGLSAEQIFGDQGVRRGSYRVIISRMIEAEIKDEHRHLMQIEEFL